MKYNHQDNQGFTLVELAIVLMIIGLLIGGILKGQELIENARITSLIRQVNAYQAAVLTFRDSYNALPGDMINPSTRLPNCSAAPCSTAGNGNGIIGTSTGTAMSVASTNTDEYHNFWIHLATANLISGIDTSGYSGAPQWGKDYPPTPLGSGFQAVHYVWGGGLYSGRTYRAFSNNFLLMNADPSNVTLNSTPTLTAGQAARIDRKMDDGLPTTGGVFTLLTTAGFGFDANGYLENSAVKNCELGFDIF
jgi:prepilin-type N-terminal cleavage/methylation domain-containing protein